MDKRIKEALKEKPEHVFKAKVLNSKTGAVIKTLKKYIGYDVLVIVKRPYWEMTEEESEKMADWWYKND